MRLLLIFCALLVFFTEGPAQNKNITFRSKLTFANESLANIWGYVKDGREYALVGGAKGLIIIDVTNPDTPKQIVRVAGLNSLWREIKTYKNVAYLTTEAGGGLQVVDLSGIPSGDVAAYRVYNYVGDTTVAKGDTVILETMKAFHSLHVDTTSGFLYLYGGNNTVSKSGALILDVKTDPYRPRYVGQYSDYYIHDGYADSDTLFACHIYRGEVAVVDTKNKKAPKVLTTFRTPNTFPHNSWLTPDRKTLLTTDEVTASYLASFDISDLNNVRQLDKVQNLSPTSIVHNTQILNNYAVTSWYRDGINITDITRPQNLVVTGTYDTYPQGDGSGFQGTWGVYPYFPSRTLVTSNLEGDFFVLTPQYKRACYLEGTVRDSATRVLLSGVRVKINSSDLDKNVATAANGTYKTGQVSEGAFSVTYSKVGYFPKTVTVNLAAGQVVLQDVELVKKPVLTLSGRVFANNTGVNIANAQLFFTSIDTTFAVRTNAQGTFTTGALASDYQVYVGAWGYLHRSANLTVTASSNALTYGLADGYQDDFWGDFGWTVSGDILAGQKRGRWELGVPKGIYFDAGWVNPNVDVATDLGTQCFATGNNGTNINDDDVDNGTTILTSPLMKVRRYNDPILSYAPWFYNQGAANAPQNRIVTVVSNGKTQVVLDTLRDAVYGWRARKEFKLKNLIEMTDSMSVRFEVTDSSAPRDWIVEAGIDAFRLIDAAPSAVQTAFILDVDLKVAPNPFSDQIVVRYKLNATAQNAQLIVTNSVGQVVEVQKLAHTEGAISVNSCTAPGVYFFQIATNEGVSVAAKAVKL